MNSDYLDSRTDIPTTEQLKNEMPRHVKYMLEFRVHQCNRFLEHKCSFHKPFNCFDWHFPNQRRRIPIIKVDRTFNYNPDLYCNTYDLSNGKCLNGQNCQYVHMNAGDTERRYHPRYFKTGMCIYETTSSGVCGKNGIHCAFAHNQMDLRPPILDSRESPSCTNNLSAQLEKERVLFENPIWNDIDYVLAFYKTSECTKLPKTCRQGYACPYYHNSKDKRRMLNTYSYQSQPCAYLKSNNDEWQDVTFCPNQDNCAFSHSRTEQQFHSEIFKSSKCNDMIKENNCPRGPFCAFAHNEEELNNGQYIQKMQNGFNKRNYLNNLEKFNYSPNSQCLLLMNTKSQINQVFHNENKIPHSISLHKTTDMYNNTSSVLTSSGSDLSSSILSDSHSKDLKFLLERCLSNSDNVAQMSDLEIQKLPELLMKYSNLEDIQIANLPVIIEWDNENDDLSAITEKYETENSEREKNILNIHSILASTFLKCDTQVFNQDKMLLYTEILKTKHKLIKVEENLEKTRHQLKSIFIQLKNFLEWLTISEIKDTYKTEIKIMISGIIKSLEENESLNEKDYKCDI